MGLAYDDSRDLFEIDIDKINEKKLNVIHTTPSGKYVLFNDCVYLLHDNKLSFVSKTRSSENIGSLYYGFSYLHSLKKTLSN